MCDLGYTAFPCRADATPDPVTPLPTPLPPVQLFDRTGALDLSAVDAVSAPSLSLAACPQGCLARIGRSQYAPVHKIRTGNALGNCTERHFSSSAALAQALAMFLLWLAEHTHRLAVQCRLHVHLGWAYAS